MPDRDVANGRYFAADRDASEELTRLQRLQDICDPGTFRQLEQLGVASGWRCLEVGAGAGSVTRWFAARALVMHMPDPAAVLRKMVTTLRPGGVLVIEDPDYGSVEAADPLHPLSEAFNACFRARIDFCLAAGIMNLRFGRSLPVLFDRLDLADVDNAAYTGSFHGADTASQFLIETFVPIDHAMIAAGTATPGEVADSRRALEDPSFIYRAGLMQFAWGRKPSAEFDEMS